MLLTTDPGIQSQILKGRWTAQLETRRATWLIWDASAGAGTINPSVVQTATPGSRLPTEGPLNHKTVPFLQTG